MPLDRVDQLPLPNLHLYSFFSGLVLFYALVYGLSSPDGLATTFTSDVWCAAAALNMCCVCFFLLTKFIHTLVFGPLRLIEQQHMKDKFWNFVFYKFIFVFGVMNVQGMQEILWWCVWFALLGTLLLTEQLCKDRFQFLSFSPNTPASSHAKIITLISVVILSCAGLFMVTAIVGWQFGFNYFTFLYSEVFILFARALHTIIRYIIHLWDMQHDGTWENRSTYTYYAELLLEMAALGIDFIHHIHMLLWANMFLSVASLILLMKLRFLYQEIQRRLQRHRNYVLVSQTLETQFVQVSSQELLMSDEVCAICWEEMRTASKLPCGHLFHMGCLRSWLEQATVCPTCRRSLSEDLRPGAADGDARGQRGRMARNWLLHFNGASIANWLPTFSLQLHQDGEGPRWMNNAAELHREAQRVHSMFPHVPLEAITLDLADTHSLSLTVERIINNVIYIPGQDRGGGDTPSTSSLPTQPHALTDAQRQPLTSQVSPTPVSPLTSDSQTTLPPTPTSSTPTHTPTPLTPDVPQAQVPMAISKQFTETSTLRKRNLASAHSDKTGGSGSDSSADGDSGGVTAVRPISSSAAPPEAELPGVKGHKDKPLASFASLLERKEKLLEKARRQYLLKKQESATVS